MDFNKYEKVREFHPKMWVIVQDEGSWIFLVSMMLCRPISMLLKRSILKILYNAKNLIALIFQHVLMIVGANNIKHSNLKLCYYS